MKKDHTRILNVGIVGGGTGCKAIMDMIRADKFKQLRMKIIGVADIDPDAKGYRHALEEGIFTTQDYTDFYQLKNLRSL